MKTAEEAPGATCHACSARIVVPILGTSFTCACGITYSASVDIAELHRAHVRLSREVEELKSRVTTSEARPLDPRGTFGR